MNIRSRNKLSATFNMSSMTDIVFLLLIFFMLTSTLVSPNALKLLLPNSSSKTLSKQSVVVEINKHLQYAVNRKMVSFDELESTLVNEMAKYEEPSIILRVDQTLEIQEAVNVMDIAYRNGFKMVLATKPG